MQKKDKNKSQILARIIIFTSFGILLFVGGGIFKEIRAKRQIQNEIEMLQKEAEKISHENSLTQERIAYLGSEDYQKKEAKDKLNLQSPDENVVIIKSSASGRNVNPTEVAVVTPPKVELRANYEKWWEHFFKY